jgi:hypothetical protein
MPLAQLHIPATEDEWLLTLVCVCDVAETCFFGIILRSERPNIRCGQMAFTEGDDAGGGERFNN